MNPSLLTRGGVVLLLLLAACHKKATPQECDALIEKYADLVVKEQFPDAGPEVYARERQREMTEAKTDVLKNCPSEVQRDELACAMKGTKTDDVIKCLQ